MAQTAQREQTVIQEVRINADEQRSETAVRPTETRYGWCPFKDIYLYNGDGTPYYYCQPESSPYHRNLPKNQLIPFLTFTKPRYETTGQGAINGKAAPPVRYDDLKTAHENATEILGAYSGWGFVILYSLQGMEQEDAFRIFRIVQPFDYSLGEIIGELSFGVTGRIDSESDIIYHLDDGATYTVEALRSDIERQKATQLAAEMFEGARVAVEFAETILGETETSMNARFSGGKGKASGDTLDKYLSKELGRKLPVLVSSTEQKTESDKNLAFLVDREKGRIQQEEIDRLKAENASLKAGYSISEGQETELPGVETAKTVFKVGESVIADGRPGVITARPFGRYKVQFEDETSGMFNSEELIGCIDYKIND